MVTPEDVEADAQGAPGRLLGDACTRCARRWRPASTRTRARPRSGPASSTGRRAPEVDTAVSEKRLRSLNEELLRVPDSFTIHRKLRKPLLGPDREARRGRDRVRARRGARVRLAADRGDAHPAHRAGHRARHVLAPPPGAPRREDRAQVRADPEPLRRAGAVRAPQQPALGDRVPRLRVRLLGGLAGEPDPLGGAVRRLRQLRPGDHRQLHRRRRVEVGPDDAPDAAAARTATRAPGPSTRAPGSSASSSSARRATSGSPTRRPRRSTSTCCAARRGSRSRARSSSSRRRGCCGSRTRRRRSRS